MFKGNYFGITGFNFFKSRTLNGSERRAESRLSTGLLVIVFLVLVHGDVLAQRNSAEPELIELPSHELGSQQISMKLRPQYLGIINNQLKSSQSVRSKSLTVKQTGASEIDQVLANVPVSNIRRTFPHAGKHEAQQIKAGLHLWYTVDVGNQPNASLQSYVNKSNSLSTTNVPADVDLESAIQDLKNTGLFEIVEQEVEQPEEALQSTVFPNDPAFHYNVDLHNDGTFPQPNTFGNELSTEDADMDVPEAWARFGRGSESDIVIAMMDNTCPYNHPELVESTWINHAEDINGDGRFTEADNNGVDDDNNGYVDDVVGWDFGDRDNDPFSVQATHGAGVWSILAAGNNNNIYKSSIAGAWPDTAGVKVMCMRVYNLSAALVYAANNGAVIFNLSYTGSNSSTNRAAVDYFRANARSQKGKRGGLVFIAAGNTGPEDTNKIAQYEPVISVGMYNQYGTFLSGSGIGDITAACVSPTISHTPTPNGTTSGYGCGTSYASPNAASMAAYLWSRVPKAHGDDIYDAMRLSSTAHDNPHAGDGFVNAYDAANYLINGIRPEDHTNGGISLDQKDLLVYRTRSSQDSVRFDFNLKNYSPQRQTCSYRLEGEYAQYFRLANTSSCNLEPKASVPVSVVYSPPEAGTFEFGEVVAVDFVINRSNGTTRRIPLTVKIWETEFSRQNSALPMPEDISPTNMLQIVAGDIDQDGYMDVAGYYFDKGQYYIALYENTGGRFVLQQVVATDLTYASSYRFALQLVDYDDDNQLELLYGVYKQSQPDNYIAEFKQGDIWKGVPEIRDANFHRDVLASSSWIDINNDGLLDLMDEPHTGLPGGRLDIYTKLYGRTLANFDVLEDFYNIGTKWVDVDFDGTKDLIAGGTFNHPGTHYSAISLNEGSTRMGEWLFGQRLYSISGNTAFTVFDADLDGGLDIIGNARLERIDLNNQYETYTNYLGHYRDNYFTNCVTRPFDSFIMDLDSNGRIDRVCGQITNNNNSISALMYLHEDEDFTRYSSEGDELMLVPLGRGNRRISYSNSIEALVADFNADGRQDVLGYDFQRRVYVLQLNQGPRNLKPNAPVGLNSTVDDDRVTMNWAPTQDDTTAEQNLRYNVAVFREDGQQVVVSPMANVLTGNPLTVGFSNADFNTFKWLRDLPAGRYQWRVQAIDASNIHSRFSAPAYFTIQREAVDLALGMQTQDNRAFNGSVVAELTVTNQDSQAAHGVVVGYQISSGMSYSSTIPSTLTFDDNHMHWHVGTLEAGQSQTILVLTDGYQRGDRFYHYAEIQAAYESDPDSTTANRQRGEDDFADARLNVLPSYADLVLSSEHVQSSEALPDRFTVDLTITNKVVPEARFVERATVQISDQNLFFQHRLAPCQLPDDNGYNHSHRLWVVSDLAVGESQTLRLTYCAAGDALPSDATLEVYAEILSASNLPIDVTTTYNNQSTDENDDTRISYQTPVDSTPAIAIESGAYIMNYCRGNSGSGESTLCYNITYYRVKNVGREAISEVSLEMQRSTASKPAYSYAWGQAYDKQNSIWTIKGLAPGRQAYLYVVHYDFMPQQTIEQSLLQLPTVDDDTTNTLEKHEWQSGKSFVLNEWR